VAGARSTGFPVMPRHAALAAAGPAFVRSNRRSTHACWSTSLPPFWRCRKPAPGGSPGFVPRCLKKRARRVNERAADALESDVEARHRLRVAFKQLRYAVEFFTPLLAGPQLADYHQSATCLQELLGRLNDLAVAAELTAEALPGGKGAVIERLAGGKVRVPAARIQKLPQPLPAAAGTVAARMNRSRAVDPGGEAQWRPGHHYSVGLRMAYSW
jgi:hypothetical protein